MKKTTMDEFLKDSIKDHVTDMHNPACNNCNDCCSMGAMLLKSEYESLRKYLKKDPAGRKVYSEAIKMIKKNETPTCVYWICLFSNNSKKCSIYYRRPLICREFHCSAELATDFDKTIYEDQEHYIIKDLFRNRIRIKKGLSLG